MPALGEPDASTTVVQCGIDPLFVRYPVRSHRADLAVTGSCRRLFEALVPALEARADRIDPERHPRRPPAAPARRAAAAPAAPAVGGAAEAAPAVSTRELPGGLLVDVLA